MMDRQRIESWFASGALVRPRAGGIATSVDLIRAIASRAGAADLSLSPRAQGLVAQIGDARHYVLVIVDGLGDELLHRHAPRGFLATHQAGRIEAVFPSTTAAALTSLATGVYPAEHAIPGWWMYLDDCNISAVSLPFVERFTERDLRQLGVPSERVFTTPSLLPRMNEAVVVTLLPYADSVYTSYSSGGCRRIAYERIDEGIDAVIARVPGAPTSSYTQLYLPQLDEMCHHRGVDGDDVAELLRAIEAQLRRLRTALPDDVRIIVTADHGHVTFSRERRTVLAASDPLLAELRAPPSGEPAVPVFHRRTGRHDSFATAFRERFGDDFALLTIDEVDAMRLLGPEPLTPLARRRFGDFLAIPPEPRGLYGFAEPGHRGIHAGLTPGEMFVPLILL